jgi:2-iminobutanoate/2-iminopropanoate deaminase
MADREQMNGLYANFFGDHLPARTTVGVAELSRGALVEVEAWAYAA